MAAQGSLECYLSKTYTNILEMITRTKPKQPHALFPGTLPPGKDSGEKEINQMFSLGEQDKLLYIICILYTLCHKDYCTMYISE